MENKEKFVFIEWKSFESKWNKVSVKKVKFNIVLLETLWKLSVISQEEDWSIKTLISFNENITEKDYKVELSTKYIFVKNKNWDIIFWIDKSFKRLTWEQIKNIPIDTKEFSLNDILFA